MTFANEAHPEKADAPIVVKLFGRERVLSEAKFAKALPAMTLQPSGKEMLSISLLSEPKQTSFALDSFPK